MNTQTEALRLALEYITQSGFQTGINEVITAIREALAEHPAQQQVFPACQGMNCGCTDGISHSPECQAEHAAAIAGGIFVKPAQQQEPYGQVTVVRRPGCVDQHWFYRWPEPPYLDNAAECHTVYTSPPASKPFVGLTDEELSKLVSCTKWRSDESMHTYAVRACRAVEAKLREKNA